MSGTPIEYPVSLIENYIEQEQPEQAAQILNDIRNDITAGNVGVIILNGNRDSGGKRQFKTIAEFDSFLKEKGWDSL
jgi:hypothetical protein